MEITLTGSQIVLVDPGDYARLSEWRWTVGSSGYAQRTVWDKTRKKQTTIAMHRLLLDFPEGKQVDHINGNKLDNRRSNLRAVTRSQNMLNRHKNNARSGYLGVHWNNQKQRWMPRIQVNGKVHYFGLFDNPEEANVVRLRELEAVNANDERWF